MLSLFLVFTVIAAPTLGPIELWERCRLAKYREPHVIFRDIHEISVGKAAASQPDQAEYRSDGQDAVEHKQAAMEEELDVIIFPECWTFEEGCVEVEKDVGKHISILCQILLDLTPCFLF